MKSRWSKFATGAVLCTLLGVVPVSAAAAASAPKPDPNATVSFAQGNAVGVSTFDPAKHSGLSDMNGLTLVYDRLMNLSANAKLLEPDLATSWKWNKKNTVLTFQLRKGVTFQDGSTFNAANAVQNILRLQANIGAATLGNGVMTAVTAPSTYVLQLNFATPNPAVIYYFSTLYSGMVSPTGLANPAMLTTTPAGGGPYELQGESATLTYTYDHWSGYWGNKTHVYPAVVEMENIVSEQTRLNAVITGALDSTYISGVTFPTAYADKASLEIAEIPTITPYTVWFNEGSAPFNNLTLRKAAVLAINKGAMSAENDGLCLKGVNGLFPKNMVGFTPSIGVPYDPTKAQQMIQKAGLTGTKISIMTYQGLSPYVQFEQIVQQEWDAIGLNVSVYQVPGASARSIWSTGQYNAFVHTQSGTSPDPTGLFSNEFQSYPNYQTALPATLLNMLNSAAELPIGSAARTAAYVKVNRYVSVTSPLGTTLCQAYNVWVANKQIIGLYSLPYAATITTPPIMFLQKTG